MCKFKINDKDFFVIVDDYLPIGFNDELLFAKSEDKTELCPSISNI